jgi:signal transduction histidine kinase
MAERMTAGTSLHTKFEVHGAPHVLAPETENNLLRVGMEALTNAVRHSGAGEICIMLTYETGQTRLSVRDNGKGIEGFEGSSGDGFGLIGMRERMDQIGGAITISNHPQGGTEVVALAPASCPARGQSNR